MVFVSDACRASVIGLPLSGVTGTTVFPNAGYLPMRSEIDVYYATRPGDPAWEVATEKASAKYEGVFTSLLLDAIQMPVATLVDHLASPSKPLKVIASRKLKPYLEATVPLGTADFDVAHSADSRVTSSIAHFKVLCPRRP